MSNEKSIAELLTSAQDRTLVLPEFQREYVWKLQDIRSFIASLCLDYPVGSFLTVEDSADLFATRPLEGMETVLGTASQGKLVYLLDGQQRLTSCHLVFSDSYKNNDVDISIRRRWFLNLKALGLATLTPLNGDELMEAFEDDGGALHAQKVDLRATTRAEYKAEDDSDFRVWCLEEGLYPLSFNVLKGDLNFTLLTRIADKRVTEIATEKGLPYGHPEYEALQHKKDKWVSSITQILNSLSKRTIPVLKIEQGATLEKVARIFETVNKTGITLSLFELLVARATSPAFPSVRKVIEDTRKSFVEEFPHSVLGLESPDWDPSDSLVASTVAKLFDAEFPKLVATLVQLETGESSLDLGKRRILRTEREAINQRTAEAAKRLYRAFAFLQLRCGIPWQLGNMPYQATILPLACALDDQTWNSIGLLNKLEAWYWAAIYSGRYSEAQDRKSRQDVFIVRKYVNEDGPKPEVVTNISESFVGQEVFREATNSDGVYRATLQYVLASRPFDLLPGERRLTPATPHTTDKNKIRKLEDHHIIPRSWLTKNRKNLPSYEFTDSCLNRAWISFEANRGRGNGAFDQNPAQYLKSLPKEVLASLFVPSDLTEDQADPLELMLTNRYALLKASILKRIAALA